MVFSGWIWTKWYPKTHFPIEICHYHWNLTAGSATLLQLTALDDILLTDCHQPVADLELQELKPPSDHQSSSNTGSSNEKFVRRSTRKRKRPDWLAINSDPVEAPAIKDKKLIRKSPNGSPIKLFCLNFLWSPRLFWTADSVARFVHLFWPSVIKLLENAGFLHAIFVDIKAKGCF